MIVIRKMENAVGTQDDNPGVRHTIFLKPAETQPEGATSFHASSELTFHTFEPEVAAGFPTGGMLTLTLEPAEGE